VCVCLGDFPGAYLGNVEIDTPFLASDAIRATWMGDQHSKDGNSKEFSVLSTVKDRLVELILWD